LAKAALVASAKAAPRTIAAESTSFLIVNIVVSFLISLSCSPPVATAKHSDPITTLEQIVRLVDYSRWALLQANWSIKLL
jgi:uncharacterized membrane protein